MKQIHAPRQGYDAKKLQRRRPADTEHHESAQSLKKRPGMGTQHHQDKAQKRDGKSEQPQESHQVQNGCISYEQPCQVALPEGPCAGTQGEQSQPEKGRPGTAEAEENQGNQNHDQSQRQKKHGKKQGEPHFREQSCHNLIRTPQQEGMERGSVPLGRGKVLQCECHLMSGLRQGYQRRLCGRVQQECREIPVLPICKYQLPVRVEPHGCIDGLKIQVIPRLWTDPDGQRQGCAGGRAQEGSTINVDMNGSTVVPGDIFDRLKGRDIIITFDMGNGILWSVDGKSITTDRAGDIDFSVQTGVNTVPVDIVNHVTGERYSIQISLAYEGEFGFTAVLSIGLGKENAGYRASLYYYNKSAGALEFICADEVSADGTVSLAFTHASDYVIVIDKDGKDGDKKKGSGGAESALPETPGGNSTVKAVKSPQTGEPRRPWWTVVTGILAIIVSADVYFTARKKKNKKNG